MDARSHAASPSHAGSSNSSATRRAWNAASDGRPGTGRIVGANSEVEVGQCCFECDHRCLRLPGCRVRGRWRKRLLGQFRRRDPQGRGDRFQQRPTIDGSFPALDPRQIAL
jgi:hypothetical protein